MEMTINYAISHLNTKYSDHEIRIVDITYTFSYQHELPMPEIFIILGLQDR